MTNLWGERLSAVITMLFAGYMAYVAVDFPVGGDMFPLFVTTVMGLLGLGMLIISFVKSGEYEHGLGLSITSESMKPILFTGLVFVYFIAIFQIGYFTSTLIFLVVTPLILGLRRPIYVASAAVLSVLFIYLIFELALTARLPQGILV